MIGGTISQCIFVSKYFNFQQCWCGLIKVKAQQLSLKAAEQPLRDTMLPVADVQQMQSIK